MRMSDLADRPAMPAGGRLAVRDLPMILMYHAVTEVAEDPDQLCVPPRRFAEQMTWLARHGLRGVGVGALVDAMRAGRWRGLVGITFDDGYPSVLDAALPELRRHGFGATAFIVSGRLGGTNAWDEGSWPLLAADGVAELAAAGIEIGSHGSTHTRLAGASAPLLSAEVGESRARLAALAGRPIRGFAYPYGSMDGAARRAVCQAGYEYACACLTPWAELGFMALPRIWIAARDGAARMTAKRVLYRGYGAVKATFSAPVPAALTPQQ